MFSENYLNKLPAQKRHGGENEGVKYRQEKDCKVAGVKHDYHSTYYVQAHNASINYRRNYLLII